MAVGLACSGDDASGQDGTETSAANTSGTATSADPTTTTSGAESSTGAPESTDTGESGTSTGDPGDTVILQNDDFVPARGLFWQTWPSPGDCWASTYAIDPELYPFEIIGVEAAIGGSPETASFELAIWEVGEDGLPSVEIDAAMVEAQGDVDGPDFDITALLGVPIVETGSFAVVMCQLDHMGSPSIGTDIDGTVDAAHNFVFQQIMGEWVPSPDFFGTDGDFVMRTIIRPL